MKVREAIKLIEIDGWFWWPRVAVIANTNIRSSRAVSQSPASHLTIWRRAH
jgi:hypothetical protein